MHLTIKSSEIITRYAILTICEDKEQECVHIWAKDWKGETKGIRIEIDCEHIQIFGKEK